jgi:hypothetical protein
MTTHQSLPHVVTLLTTAHPTQVQDEDESTLEMVILVGGSDSGRSAKKVCDKFFIVGVAFD